MFFNIELQLVFFCAIIKILYHIFFIVIYYIYKYTLHTIVSQDNLCVCV